MDHISSDLARLLSKQGRADYPKASMFLYASIAIGAYKLTSLAFKILRLALRHTVKRVPNLMKKYADPAKKPWAVVTGGSDGIGEQFCRDLAARGFNICIIARNEQKIKDKLQSITDTCGKAIETRYVIADLGEMTKYAEYERIASELADIDIAMLFLNAGWGLMGPFKDITGIETE